MDFLEGTSGILLKNLWVMLPGTTLEIYFSNNSRDALGFLRNSCKISYKAFILQKHYRIIIKFLLRFVEKTLQNLSQNFLKNFFFSEIFLEISPKIPKKTFHKLPNSTMECSKISPMHISHGFIQKFL